MMLKIVKLSFKASEKCLGHICFIKPDKDSSRKKTLQTSHPHEHRHKNSQQNTRKSNPAMLCKNNSTPQSLWFVPGTKGWFSFPKSGDIIHHTNSLKGKKHLIMSVHAGKKKLLTKFSIHS